MKPNVGRELLEMVISLVFSDRFTRASGEGPGQQVPNSIIHFGYSSLARAAQEFRRFEENLPSALPARSDPYPPSLSFGSSVFHPHVQGVSYHSKPEAIKEWDPNTV